MSELKFEKFESIKRLKRSCVITEKLDGTNAQICFDKDGNILCGSRKRKITPDNDNHGFASWAYDRQDALFNVLGEGRHFGEWWGQGIQRRYDMDKRVFSLFNTGRWHSRDLDSIEQLDVVPVLYKGEFTSEAVDKTLEILMPQSVAAPEFTKPEGVVIYHSQIKQMFKVTFEYDEKGKAFGA